MERVSNIAFPFKNRFKPQEHSTYWYCMRTLTRYSQINYMHQCVTTWGNMCIQWTHVLYSVVITWHSNPTVSQFISTYNEFTSVWSMLVYNSLFIIQFFTNNTNLNRTYDVCSCFSQSEDTNLKVLSVKTEFMRVYERAWWFDLQLENSCLWVMYCKLFKIESNWLEQGFITLSKIHVT